jgi:hypothetical protein
MKSKTREKFVPRALREVWEWKDSIYQEVKHQPTDRALHEIMRMAHELAVVEGSLPTAPSKVAESSAQYKAVCRRTKAMKR